MKSLLSFIYMLLFATIVNGQLIGIESSIPPGANWRQLNTDTVRVVYPEGLESQARRLGGMVHYMAENHNASLGDKVKKIDIFLLNQSVVSNGYVATPPFHSKFYTQAPQVSFAGTTDWLDLLAIHEYRHVLQMSNALKGPTKWLYYAFGEILWAGAAHLAAPPWFWEGDAIMQETLLTHSGRGTVPGFGVYLKTIADMEEPWSYEKMVCGSYKDLIPNHYYLGYDLCLYGRANYGNDFWKDIYKEATGYRSIIWPFSNAIWTRTGLRTDGFYREMMASLSNPIQENSVPLLMETNSGKNIPTMYSYPKFRNEKEVIALKEDFNRPGWFISLTAEGEEEEILQTGYGMGTFDVNQDRLVWNESASHPRWADVSYSNIFIYDFNSRKTRQLSMNTRYFAPSFSPDGKLLVVVETDESMQNSLVVLDIDSGKLLERFSLEGNPFLTYPDWLNQNHLVVVAQKNSYQSLLMIGRKEQLVDTLVYPQRRLIEHVSCQNGKVYYSTNATNHKNQLVCVDPESGSVQRSDLNLVPYLLEMPAVSGDGKVVFVNSRLNQKTLTLAKEKDVFGFIPETGTLEQLEQIYQEGSRDYALMRLTAAEGGKLPDTFAFNAHEKNYRPGFHKMRLHSWILNPSYPSISLMLQANDALGTSGLYVEPGYNFNEGAFFTNINISYGAYFPRFDVGLSSLVNRSALFFEDGEHVAYNWNEMVVNGSVQLPIRFTRRHYLYRFNPVIGYRYINASGYPSYLNNEFHVLSAEFNGLVFQKSAYRSIKPRFGVDVRFSVKKVINNNDQPVLSAGMDLYLPGLFPTHSTWFDLDYRCQADDSEYVFLDNYFYAGVIDPETTDDWITGVKAFYGFPLWYPDIAAGPFAFFKRLRMNLNYKVDVYPAFSTNDLTLNHSVGFELVTDARYFRLFDQPIGLGLDVGITDGFGPLTFRIVLQ